MDFFFSELINRGQDKLSKIVQFESQQPVLILIDKAAVSSSTGKATERLAESINRKKLAYVSQWLLV